MHAPGAALGFDHVTATAAKDLRGLNIVRIMGQIINFQDYATVVPVLTATPRRNATSLGSRTVPLGLDSLAAQRQVAFATSYPLSDGHADSLTLGFRLAR